jgi:predicted ferric reductase
MNRDLSHDVHLFYTVRHPDEALFVDEILAVATRNPRLKIYIRYSATQGSLTVEEIARHAPGNLLAHHIYMCGPLPMIQTFERKFQEMGVPANHIHYEEFNFR